MNAPTTDLPAPAWHTTMRSCMLLGTDDTALAAARGVLTTWLAGKWPRLRVPETEELLCRGEALDIVEEGTHLRVLSMDGPGWAFELTQLDRFELLRTWVTRVVFRHSAHEGVLARLQNGYLTQAAHVPRPTVPAFMRELVHRVGARDANTPLQDEPLVIDTAARFQRLQELLLSEQRVLPVVVVAPFNRTGTYPVDLVLLSRHLLGIAHVVAVDDLVARWLGQVLGALEVYNGAARLYRPGLKPSHDTALHPLYLPPRASRQAPDTAHMGYLAFLQDRTFELTTSLLPAVHWPP